jgi:hypothetical protein
MLMERHKRHAQPGTVLQLWYTRKTKSDINMYVRYSQARLYIVFSILEGYGAATLADWSPTFRDTLAVSSSTTESPIKNTTVSKRRAPITCSHDAISQKYGDINRIAANA